MLNIRFGAFETNSSSVHSLIMCSAEEYKKLEDGELYVDSWSDAVITASEAANKIGYSLSALLEMPDDEAKRLLQDKGVYTLDGYREYYGYEYETYREERELPSGEKVVAFGYYGHD